MYIYIVESVLFRTSQITKENPQSLDKTDW